MLTSYVNIQLLFYNCRVSDFESYKYFKICVKLQWTTDSGWHEASMFVLLWAKNQSFPVVITTWKMFTYQKTWHFTWYHAALEAQGCDYFHYWLISHLIFQLFALRKLKKGDKVRLQSPRWRLKMSSLFNHKSENPKRWSFQSDMTKRRLWT